MKIKQETAEVMTLEQSPLKGYAIGVVIIFLGLLVVFQSGSQPWLGLVLTGVGVVIILMTKRVTITMDKKAGRMVIARKPLIGGKTEEHDLGTLKYLELYYKRFSGMPGGRSKQQQNTLNLAFVFTGTNEVMLDSYRSVAPGMFAFFLSKIHASTLADMGAKVARFLDVPFQDHRQVNMAEALSTVQSGVESSIQQVFGDGEK